MEIFNQEVEEKWAIGIITAVLVVSVGLCIMNGLHVSSNAAYASELESQQQSALAEYEAAKNEPVASADDLKKQLNSATEAGDLAAELQNDAVNASPALSGDDLIQFGDDMRELFEDAGAVMTWYSSSANVDFTWTFASTFEFSGTNLDCVWLARDDETGDLLAYAFATYSAETEMFSEFSVHVTSKGNENASVTPASSGTSNKSKTTTNTEMTVVDASSAASASSSANDESSSTASSRSASSSSSTSPTSDSVDDELEDEFEDEDVDILDGE